MDETGGGASRAGAAVSLLGAAMIIAIPVTIVGAETIKWSAALGQVGNPTYTGATAYVVVFASYVLVVSVAVAVVAFVRSRSS